MNKEINDAMALLEEVIVNGKKGKDYLYAWFLGEQSLIENTILDLNENDLLPTCVCESTGGWLCPVHGKCF